MRSPLAKKLAIKDFRSYYWLKEELQTFCRENRISASGSKHEISDIISVFIETGEIQKLLRKTKSSTTKTVQNELTLEMVITENHRCSQSVRAFFILRFLRD